MGRMKVYGGSWNLPDAPFIEDPFQKYLLPDGDTCKAATMVEPPVRQLPSPPRLTPQMYDDEDDEIQISKTQSQPQSP